MSKLFRPGKTLYALEAHHALSAKIVEKAGFPVIWASGLTLSASLGHRDCNELSWSQVCDQISYMLDAVSTPILVDGDTGFGNFNNVRELVKRLSRDGAAGVCLEDKIFPKTNSYLPYNQSLTSISEFSGKIKAAKDSQKSTDFQVIARTEALISGLGMEEALARAYAYKEAGADAILIHSKKSNYNEIEEFSTQWNHSLPLVIIPTTYPTTPPYIYEKLGISLVIWANQLLRASVDAMQKAAKMIFEEQSIQNIDKMICPLSEIFSLTNEDELRAAEKKYTRSS